MLLRGAHGSRLLHIATDEGTSLCGCDTTYRVVNLYDRDLLCWGCSDLSEGANPTEYPLYGIEQQIPRLLAQMPYANYLQSEHWRWIRQVALDHYGRRCMLCGSWSKVEVHHRTYERRGRELLSDLTVLCSDCHSRFHRAA